MTKITNIQQVKLNIMTQSQYNSATKNANELYMITDAPIDYNDLINKPTIPTTPSQVGALPDTTKYGSGLSYSNDQLQLKDQDGNALGNSVTIKASADIDGKSITKNTSDELQTVGVIDQNDTVNAIKTWSGTRAEFEAIATKDPNTIYNVEDDFHKEGVIGFGRNVGDIFYTTRTDSELNGAVECNGATYNINDFTGEQAIGNLLGLNKLPYVSLSEYQTAIDTNGSCRAFGWNGGDSFRVPTLQDVYIEAGTALTAGEFINESLPNITGKFASSEPDNGGIEKFGNSSNKIMEGAFYLTDIDSSHHCVTETSGNYNGGALAIDASRSSPAYQDGAKVKPDSIRYRAMVQLANEATDEALITATRALQQISYMNLDKANIDASNFNATGKSTIVGWGMPDYSKTTSASTTIGQVQSVLVDSEIRIIQTGSGNDYYMYCNIVPCSSDGIEITGYCLTGSGGYTGAVSGNSIILKAGSYFKVKSWNAMTANNIIITPLFGG